MVVNNYLSLSFSKSSENWTSDQISAIFSNITKTEGKEEEKILLLTTVRFPSGYFRVFSFYFHDVLSLKNVLH